MLYWNPDSDSRPFLFRHCAATIGNFDGVHCGHAEILRRLKAWKLPAVVFTFSRHPRQILRPAEAPELLTWNERKAELLKQQGADEVVFCETSALLPWTAETFFQRVIVDFLDAAVLVEGPNFHFGRGCTGNTQVLAELCAKSGRSLEVIETLHEYNGESISSSRIRQLLESGNIQEANALLTAPFRLRGTVIHGEARGRTLGFPTANLGMIETIIPAWGVYACRAILESGESFPAAVHIGPNVTFHETQSKVEVFLMDFTGSVYERKLQVEFLARLRDLVTFSGPEELMAQIRKDVEQVYLIGRQKFF